jgi:ferredoxin
MSRSVFMRVKLNKELCCNYAACERECPEVFAHDANGIVELRNEHIPVELEERVRSAAAACPQGVITVVDEQPIDVGPGE